MLPLTAKPSYYVQGLHIDIERKQLTRFLLETSRYIYGHQNTAYRTESNLIRWHCATLVSSPVVRSTRVVVSLYTSLSLKAAEIVDVLKFHLLQTSLLCTRRYFLRCKHVHFLNNDQWCGCLLQGRYQNMSVLTGVSHRKTFRSCIRISMTLSKLYIPYSHMSGWIYPRATWYITGG